MKAKLPERLYLITLLIVFIGIIFHAPLSVGLGVLFPDYSLLIKSWKEILMCLLIPLAILIVTKRKLWHELMSDWIFRIILIYTALHLFVAALFWQGIAPTLAGLAIDLRYILFFGLVYVIVRVLPQARRSIVIAAIVGAFVVTLFAVLQLFLPPDILKYIGYSKETITPYLTVDKNPDYIRVNSTLRGPNPLGAYAGMVLGLLAAAIVRLKLNLKDKKVLVPGIILALASSVALWISYSRSALFAGIITVLIVVGIRVAGKTSWRGWAMFGVGVIVVVAGLVAARDTSFVSNVILHENQNGGSEISSNEGHVESLQYGITQLFREPLGSGVGSTGSASLFGAQPTIVENQYLFVGHEIGWLGLVLFLVLFVLIVVRLWKRKKDWLALGLFASGVGLGLIGILLPVWVDDTVSIIWWGLAATALAGGAYDRRKTK
jgi:hypothetical protein